MTNVIISRVRAEQKCFYSIINYNLWALAGTGCLHPVHLDLLDQLFHQEHKEHKSLGRAETVSALLQGSTMLIKALPTSIFSNSKQIALTSTLQNLTVQFLNHLMQPVESNTSTWRLTGD